jgi:CRISPR type III-A-associated RAMP protein Csm4
VPLPVVEALLAGQPLNEEDWRVDGLSQCLVPSEWGHHGPFRTAIRSSAAVDRLSGNVEAHRTACLEFGPGSGMWAVGVYADQENKARWAGPVQAALRLLADSGLGGERSRGWGRSAEPEFREGILPDIILRGNHGAAAGIDAEPQPAPETAYWLLSLFAPAAGDCVDWNRGDYSLVTRGGRVESPAARGEPKKLSRMVAEGSVIFTGAPPSGTGHDVAPEGFPHPVYRAGFALALPIPWREAPR